MKVDIGFTSIDFSSIKPLKNVSLMIEGLGILQIRNQLDVEKFGFDFDALLASSPSKHYKVFNIPKRNFGFRVIAQPTPEVKNVQREIVKILAENVNIHPAAMAYVKNVSIKTNALKHRNSSFLLKTDLENFFNSIKPKMLFDALKNQGVHIWPFDENLMKQFLFWNRSKKEGGRLRLSVGAPSSPFISNLIMYNFDVKVEKLCKSREINYSRYADDLTFSSNKKGVLFPLLTELKKILHDEFNSILKINESKTVFSSKAHNRHVTGITITNKNELSVGREKKRYISALVHKFKNEQLGSDDINHLKGLLSFVSHIEPDFKQRMIKKYGAETIVKLNNHQSGDTDEK